MSANTIAKFADLVRNPDPLAGPVDACSDPGALRVDKAGGLWRYTGDPVEPYQLLVPPYPATLPPGPPGPVGPAGPPGMPLSAAVLAAAGVAPLAAGIIQLYDASALANGAMVLQLPAVPTQPLGIKNTSSSVVEGPNAAPAATAIVSLARGCCLFSYHAGTGTWWIT